MRLICGCLVFLLVLVVLLSSIISRWLMLGFSGRFSGVLLLCLRVMVGCISCYCLSICGRVIWLWLEFLFVVGWVSVSMCLWYCISSLCRVFMLLWILLLLVWLVMLLVSRVIVVSGVLSLCVIEVVCVVSVMMFLLCMKCLCSSVSLCL